MMLAYCVIGFRLWYRELDICHLDGWEIGPVDSRRVSFHQLIRERHRVKVYGSPVR